MESYNEFLDMQRFLNSTLLLMVFCLAMSCSDDEEPDNSFKLELYCYSPQDTGKHLVPDKDTLDVSVSLGDTLFLSLDVTGDYRRYNVWAYGFEYNDIGDLTYRLIATKAGLAYIDAFVYGSGLNDASASFFADISSFSYIIVPVEKPALNIDVENESLKSAIQTELENAYDLEFPAYYTLTCNTFTGGDLQLVTAQKDTITGTFITSTVFGLTDLILSYSNAIYTCTVEESAPEPGYYFHLKQDLTGEFRVKYPAETINEITITTLCVMHKTE